MLKIGWLRYPPNEGEGCGEDRHTDKHTEAAWMKKYKCKWKEGLIQICATIKTLVKFVVDLGRSAINPCPPVRPTALVSCTQEIFAMTEIVWKKYGSFPNIERNGVCFFCGLNSKYCFFSIYLLEMLPNHKHNIRHIQLYWQKYLHTCNYIDINMNWHAFKHT